MEKTTSQKIRLGLFVILGLLIFIIAVYFIGDKQKMLESGDLKVRAQMVLEHLTKELQMLELKNQIQSKVRVDIDKQQREYFLHQQLKQIQEELGGDSPDLEIENLRQRGAEKKWSKEVSETSNVEPAAPVAPIVSAPVISSARPITSAAPVAKPAAMRPAAPVAAVVNKQPGAGS